MALLHDLVELGGQDLAGHRSGHQARDLLHGLEIRPARLGDQGRIGGDAVDHAPFEAGLDLFHVSGIEKELHLKSLRVG
jgi:hypothetical protein